MRVTDQTEENSTLRSGNMRHILTEMVRRISRTEKIHFQNNLDRLNLSHLWQETNENVCGFNLAFAVSVLETGAEWLPTSVSQRDVEEEEVCIKALVYEEQQSRILERG